MPRIRTIKPEFYVSPQIASCSRDARLLFIGLWSFSDDAGIHPASYLRLKMEVFPADNCTEADIQKWVTELMTNDLIIEYEAEGKRYWQVTGWSRHQKIEKPNYKYPKPSHVLSSHSKPVDNLLTDTSKKFDEQLPTRCQILEDLSSTSRLGNGMESKGKENTIRKVSDKTLPDGLLSTNKIDEEVTELFQYWQQLLNHPKAKLDKKRQDKLLSALKLGYSVEELKQAIEGCKRSDWHMGRDKNNLGKIYDDINIIFRDAEHIEKFIAIAQSKNSPLNFNQPASSLFEGVI